ncbi:MAG: DNA-directed RNA polymerase subunit A' [Promethearchaeota archaeon]
MMDDVHYSRNFMRSPAQISSISRVQFGILSGKEIAQMSVCEVRIPKAVENGIPIEDGVMDSRMGTCDDWIRCATCNGNVKECPGHFGHIRLAHPVFHPGFITHVLKILNCVCFQCGKIRGDTSHPRFQDIVRTVDQKTRFDKMSEFCKKIKVCNTTIEKKYRGSTKRKFYKDHGGCGAIQPEFSRNVMSITLRYKDSGRGTKQRNCLPEEVINVFKKITNGDCRKFGIFGKHTRPESMILTMLPVLPPVARCSVKHGASQRAEDDLTRKLLDILLANNALKRKRTAPSHQSVDLRSILQYHVATFYNSSITGYPEAMVGTKSKRPVQSIYHRIKGKEGRVRGNLMGKRVDFCARTVITPDSHIQVDEIGVPITIAKNVTIPERVTSFNILKLQQLVKNGTDEHPGANAVIDRTGKFIPLENMEDEIYLQNGWIVERHLRDGDPVLLNRQPTLHKMSMMGHRVRILPFSTFRLNLSATTPYNADFDGDEMNMHIPQSLLTQAELLELAMVGKNMISAQNNRPAIGIVQDTLLGSSLMTRRDAFIPKRVMMNCMMCIANWNGKIPTPTILKPVPLWTGKQLISMILSPSVNLRTFNNLYHKNEGEDTDISTGDTTVIIEDGELLTGILDKKTLGATHNSIIHIIYRDLCANDAMQFVNSLQQIVTYWLQYNGFSVGISDTIADKKTMIQINDTIAKSKQEVRNVVRLTLNGSLRADPGRTLVESFEHQVNCKLNEARDASGRQANISLSSNNRLKAMITAGSKGGELNISQIVACVGQQNVCGKRIPKQLSHNRRTLPHFESNDNGPEARGFIENSYLKGLTPTEFFYHAMSGREGIIDTACKTADTGYKQRRIIKCMEDVRVEYDYTVRDSKGRVIQFLYGEDSMSGEKLEFQKFTLLSISDRKFDELFRYDFNKGMNDQINIGKNFGIKKGQKFMTRLVYNRFFNQEEQSKRFEILQDEYDGLKNYQTLLREEIFLDAKNVDRIAQPVNVKRIIKKAQRAFSIQTNPLTKYYEESDLDPVQVVFDVEELIADLKVLRQSNGGEIIQEIQQNACLLFSILLKTELASKRVLSEYNLREDSFKWVLHSIKDAFYDSIVTPMEMVGVLAAQSIGEPATQMTLNTFHHAGVSSKNVTLGVPRLEELLNVSKNPKTPSLTIYVNKDMVDDEHDISAVMDKMRERLEFVKFGDVVKSSAIYYDPFTFGSEFKSCIENDNEFIKMSMMGMDPTMYPYNRFGSFVLRFVLDNREMSDFDIYLVIDTLQTSFLGKDDYFVSHSDNSDDFLIIRIRVIHKYAIGFEDDEFHEGEDDNEDTRDCVSFLQKLTDALYTIKLRGIDGIKSVFPHKIDKRSYNHDGMVMVKEDIIETNGSNLYDVLREDCVDYQKTTSNDVIETYNVLGIEAARLVLFRELQNVIEFDGSYVNYRHLLLLVDKMCHFGEPIPISRHGMQKTDTGFLQQLTFENATKVLFESALFSKSDPLNDPSSRIMHGIAPRVGTGGVDIMIDEDFLTKNTPMYGGDTTTTVFEPTKGTIGTTPYGVKTPYHRQSYPQTPIHFGFKGGSESPLLSGQFSPIREPQSTSWEEDTTSPFACEILLENYSPSRPNYSPSNPGNVFGNPLYSPTSPQYSPSSPQYSPSSPQYSPSSPQYSPSSPQYSPSRNGNQGKLYSPSSPQYSPSHEQYSPSSPDYSPTREVKKPYSPSSPSYDPQNK